ncbi:PhnO protein [hydrothermal vent metagenome]|uniref:PhnO protein n=1 Tax=hydrothermal vent metagenome TaxID=652676 RepID=A0A3B0VXR4_9ZZZZ
MHCKYIIEGVTEDGRKFRPSDWIDRISSMGASYRNQRLVYSDLLHPELYNGQKCLIIDTELEIKDPSMFQYVMNFVNSNGLKMSHVCEIVEKKLGS